MDREHAEPTERAPRSAIPVPGADVVPLRRVHRALTSATGRVAVVTAPAGYGKTAQVASWALADGRPVAWADLEAIDDDPRVLVTLLLDLLGRVSDVHLDRPAPVRAAPGQYARVVAPALGRLVQRCTAPFVLVLDDAHHVRSTAAADLLDFLVAHVPPSATIVLVGRSAPAPALARPRAHGAVVDVTVDDLALDVDDAQRLLARAGAPVGPVTAARLVARTEGWPVGLRLAAQSLQESVELGEVRSWTGEDLALADYLREEWLRGLDADDVDFLLAVSGLDWLSAPLCDDVLDRSDSGERLRLLHERRCVVMPLDRRGDAYRMHRSLRDVLDAESARVDRRRRCLVDLRASEWFERTGDIDRAMAHAMRSGDLALAERLVADHAPGYHVNGQYATVARWLAWFPRSYVTTSAPLCLMAAVNAVAGGDADAAMTWLRFGERALDGPPSPATDATTELRLSAYRALIATTDLHGARIDAARAYRLLPGGVWHAVACLAHGACSFIAGDADLAASVLAEGAVEGRIVGAPTVEALCHAHLAAVHADAEDWPAATAAARHARSVVRDHGLDDMPTMCVVTAMSALVEAVGGHHAVAAAEIVAARNHLAAVESVAAWGNIVARLALARASLLLGDHVAARTFVDELEVLLRAQPESTRWHAQLRDLAGRLRAARSDGLLGASALTTAELRVLHHLPTNLTLGEIAARLYVSRTTAKSHAAAVYRKLGATSRGAAVDAARAAGLLPAGDPADH